MVSSPLIFEAMPSLAAGRQMRTSRRLGLYSPICNIGGSPSRARADPGTKPLQPAHVVCALSLDRPGGNITGVTINAAELVPEHIEVVHELLPMTKVIALLANPASPIVKLIVKLRVANIMRLLFTRGEST